MGSSPMAPPLPMAPPHDLILNPPDEQREYSSVRTPNEACSMLDDTTGCQYWRPSAGAWVGAWMQIDLAAETPVSGIVTQPRSSHGHWRVNTYSVKTCNATSYDATTQRTSCASWMECARTARSVVGRRRTSAAGPGAWRRSAHPRHTPRGHSRTAPSVGALLRKVVTCNR